MPRFLNSQLEPPRGYTDPPGNQSEERVELGEAIRELTTKPAFWYMTAGATVAAFCGYGISSFQSIFLVRAHGITAGEAAIWINAPVSMSSAIGTFATGWLATQALQKSPRRNRLGPQYRVSSFYPLLYLRLYHRKSSFCRCGLVIGGFVKYGYIAAQYTIGQGVVSTRARAMATAVLLFVANLIGYGFGPLFIGAISDVFFIMASEVGLATDALTRNQCHPRSIKSLTTICRGICGERFTPKAYRKP